METILLCSLAMLAEMFWKVSSDASMGTTSEGSSRYYAQLPNRTKMLPDFLRMTEKFSSYLR